MVEFVDLHADYILRHIKGAEKAGVRAALASVWTTEMQDPIQEIKSYRKIIDGLDSSVKLLLHIEDAWFLDESNIEELIELRPYSVGLTWNYNNDLAGGAHGDGRLTELGRRVLKKFVASGVVIDLAHLNRASFWDVVGELGGRRLLCTHTCFDEVNPHNRNLDRKQIQTIVDSGGIVGLTFVGEFLGIDGATDDFEILFNHIKYFIENFGEDNLAIGTDFLGAARFPRGLCAYKDLRGLERFLLGKGLNKRTINKIFCENGSRTTGLSKSYVSM